MQPLPWFHVCIVGMMKPLSPSNNELSGIVNERNVILGPISLEKYSLKIISEQAWIGVLDRA